MAKTTTEELTTLFDFVTGRVTAQLEAMPDEEYLWEPVAGCWSVRPGTDGVLRADRTSFPDPHPAPFTTVAWRVWHIGTECMLGYCHRFFGDEQGVTDEWPGNAKEGLAQLANHLATFRAHVAAMDDAALSRLLGPANAPYDEDSYHALVLHALDEVIHHTAEIGVIRDLYRTSDGGRAWAR